HSKEQNVIIVERRDISGSTVFILAVIVVVIVLLKDKTGNLWVEERAEDYHVHNYCTHCKLSLLNGRFQSEVHVEEIEITPKRKKKTKQFKDSLKFRTLVDELLNEVAVQNTAQFLTELSNTILFIEALYKNISIAEEKHNKSIHEVLRCYYDLGEALSKLYDNFYNASHDCFSSKQQVIQEFKRQLNINTLDMALVKEKNEAKRSIVFLVVLI
ncbi:1323_t:CDS:2, partial [Dentiscutata erythropus]